MQEFEEFWKAYPRRVARGDARRAWEKALKREPALLAKCLEALEWQIGVNEWDGGKYTPHASTYLNQERYDDERVLTAGERAEMASFLAWKRANADNPDAQTVSFDVFQRYMHARRREGAA